MLAVESLSLSSLELMSESGARERAPTIPTYSTPSSLLSRKVADTEARISRFPGSAKLASVFTINARVKGLRARPSGGGGTPGRPAPPTPGLPEAPPGRPPAGTADGFGTPRLSRLVPGAAAVAPVAASGAAAGSGAPPGGGASLAPGLLPGAGAPTGEGVSMPASSESGMRTWDP